MTASGGGSPGSHQPEARDPVLARLQPRWSATRTEDNLAVAFRRIERGGRLRRGAVAGALGLGALVLVVGGLARRGPAPLASSTPTATVPASRRLELPDGLIVALEGGARAVLARTSRERLDVELGGGAASFQVPLRRERTVVVRVARFEVTILAARFELVPVGERVRVAVDDGEVAVAWPGGDATVKRGETVMLPADVADAPDVEVAAGHVHAHAVSEPRARFRSQVARRDYAGAYRSLEAAPGVADHSAEDLMLAADAARLSGHPASAVPYLRRLLRAYPSDVRGPVAAFTLGRVLLADLGRAGEAADAFAESSRLAPTGPLAADALAREVEAAARAGDAARARRVAAIYAARYPNEPRGAVVRRAAGLE